MQKNLLTTLLAVTILGTVCAGCSSAYYGAMEKLGYAKRDILASRVTDAREAQSEAKDEFKNALERFRSVVTVKGGTLEEKYRDLEKQLARSETRAKQVRDRISAVEDVSEALFDEWEDELKQYTNDRLRQESASKLKMTRLRYEDMIRTMKNAAGRLEPALAPLRDNVLFLKHNLNARAIDSLGDELVQIEGGVNIAIRELERSIQEADRFIETLD